MFDSVAVVGATGAVGTLIVRLLQERKFPYKRMKFLASKRSVGKVVPFNGGEIVVEELCPDAFNDVDLVIASTPDDVARDFIPEARKRAKVVVDESGYWRMYPDVPLVIRARPPGRREHVSGDERRGTRRQPRSGREFESVARQ